MKRPLAVFCLAFILAVWGFVFFRPPQFPDFSGQSGRECRVIGRVERIEYKTIFGKQQSVLYLKQITYFKEIQENYPTKDQEQMPEGVVCYIGKEEPVSVRIGSTVLAVGVFEEFPGATNPGEFDAALYYRILGLSGKLKNAEILKVSADYARLADFQFRLRCFLEKKIRDIYPSKEAGIMMTMLFGNKTELDGEIRDLYRDAGILHILSVSGLHVSVLGYGLYRLFRRLGLPVRLCAVLAAGWMWFYGGMIGMGISAFRAVFMFGIRMLAKAVGRTYDLLTALAVAAAVLIGSEPLYLYHSGFWLSFTCVLAISLLYPRLRLQEKEGGKIKIRLINSFLLSVSVTIMTLPVFLWFYYEVSFWGMLWNLVVVPLMSVVLGGGVVNLILPEFATGLSQLVAKGNCVILYLFEVFGRITEQTGFGNLILGQPAVVQILIFVVGMLLFIVLIGKKEDMQKYSQKDLPECLQKCSRKYWQKYFCKYWQKILVLLCLIGIVACRHPDGFRLTFLDVGQGDGICLQNDNGNVYLIDGGSSSKSRVGTYQILPFLKQQGIRQVEAVFISHADTDHISGILELLKQQKGGVKLKRVVLSDLSDMVLWEEYGEIIDLCRENGTDVCTMKKGQQLQDDKLTLTCLHPDSDFAGESNASSQVLKVDFGSFSALLMGDLEAVGERCLEQTLVEQEIGEIALLKVAHHGSRNSTSQEILNQLQPQVAIISCGKNNRYGHPHEELLERLETVGAKVMCTEKTGAVVVMVDGKQMKVSGYVTDSRDAK